ncbi:GLPGLI family protein [Gelidibacter salicanalis]|uniref:GLPGLI family protein n=1 Tax=Gelidibacter salicanalis TaxID=291193 RepID=A0A934NH26_9FLAO|nr:GLPGLI family protein [Gelidibacter salicanalis]MBJ7880306.1 GLPGLI family protein [Gelidibacter salicanalis]
MKLVTITFFSFLMLLGSGSLMAQEFQGRAIYMSKTSMDMSNFGGDQMSEQQKKMFAERMKNMLEKTYVLSFNRTESIYKEEEKLAAPGGGGGGRMGGIMGSFTAGPQYKNVKDQQLIQDQEFFGKQFLIKDSIPQLEWKMENESKQIGQYLSFKATAVKKGNDLDVTNMSRRNRTDESRKDSTKTNSADALEVPKEIIVTAWYTPQIPVNQGPGEYWGLPGLILEVNAGRTTILCTKIEINPTDKLEIKAPSKGKEVTKTEYEAIVKEKTEEMREMNGGRGRGRN